MFFLDQVHIKYHIPLILTFIRLIVSPLSLPFLIVYLPHNSIWVNSLLALFFLAFSVTDFLDGYLARKLQQVTVLGKMLDPIADKFLIFSTLIALLAVHKIWFFWVIVLVGREFFVMGLRHIALEKHFVLDVSHAGKIKMVLQVLLLASMIANPYQHLGFICIWNMLENIVLYATLGLSLWSAYCYYVVFIKKYKERQ